VDRGDVRTDGVALFDTAGPGTLYDLGYLAMSSVEAAEYRNVFETIRQWPTEARRDLLRDVSRTLDEQRPVRPTRGYSADEVIRMLKPDRPAPGDEECDRILEDELMRKYGL
jgi:hypothetical protein